MAAVKFGAVYGQGYGHHGSTYAIPTKGRNLEVLSLKAIQKEVSVFLAYAQAHPELTFLVTPIGCGYAGYRPEDIAPLFFPLPNVVYPASFLPLLSKIDND